MWPCGACRLRLPFSGDERKLVFSILISSLGYSQLLAVGVVYFTRFVRLTPAEVGLGMSISLIVGTMAGVPAGRLADRRTPRAVFVSAVIVQGAAGLALAFAPSFGYFVLLLTLYRIAGYGAVAAKNTIIGILASGREAAVVRARMRSAGNLGVMLGLPAAGLALQMNNAFGDRAVLAANGALILATVPFAARISAGRHRTSITRAGSGPARSPMRDPSYLALTGLSGLLFLLGPLLDVAMPLWIAARLSVSPVILILLYLQNAVIIVFCQAPASRRLTGVRRAARAQVCGGVCAGIACVVWGEAGQLSGWPVLAALVLGGLLHAAGELCVVAGNWILAFELAPADQQGEYGAVNAWGSSLALLAGPSVSAAVVSAGIAGWAGLGAAFAVVGAAAPMLMRWRLRARPDYRLGLAVTNGGPR